MEMLSTLHRREDDVERRLERLECIITNFPPEDDLLSFSTEVVSFNLGIPDGIVIFSFFNFSGRTL